jgi:hypothetical protein
MPPFRLLGSEAGTPSKVRVWAVGQNGHGVENIQVALQAGNQSAGVTKRLGY